MSIVARSRHCFCRGANAAAPLVFALMLAQAIPPPALAAEAGSSQPGGEIQRFCSNIADAARDRRYALQTKRLENLKAEIDKRVEALEKKRAEYEDWLRRREEFLAKAQDNVVAIYSNMTPDAAAEKLAALNVELAAAIVMKLDPRKAGVILNEMNSKVAAALTGVMADAARRNDPS